MKCIVKSILIWAVCGQRCDGDDTIDGVCMTLQTSAGARTWAEAADYCANTYHDVSKRGHTLCGAGHTLLVDILNQIKHNICCVVVHVTDRYWY